MNPFLNFETEIPNFVSLRDIARSSRNMKLFVKYIFSRTTNVMSQIDTLNTESDDEPIQDDESLVHIAKLFLLAALLRLGKRVTQHIDCSYYEPDFSSTSLVSDVICDLIISNRLRKGFSPAFISLVSRLYFGYIDFYRYLRLRKSENEITRVELRALKRYETLGSRDSWPVFTPILGILAFYGIIIFSSEFSTRYTPHGPTLFGTEQFRRKKRPTQASQTDDILNIV
jgi:hypothetical protein